MAKFASSTKTDRSFPKHPFAVRSSFWPQSTWGKYDVAHQALMNIPGTKISAEQMREAIKASGMDMDRMDADLAAHADEITALLRRNLAQADSLGLQGTPGYLIGQYKVTSALNYDGFKKAVADARALAAKR